MTLNPAHYFTAIQPTPKLTICTLHHPIIFLECSPSGLHPPGYAYGLTSLNSLL